MAGETVIGAGRFIFFTWALNELRRITMEIQVSREEIIAVT